MEPPIDLLRALELAHYAAQHRGATMVIALGGDLHVADFLLDLRLLGAYGLSAVLVVRSAAGSATPLLAQAASVSTGLQVLEGTTPEQTLTAQIGGCLSRGEVPVVVHRDPDDGCTPGPVKRLASRLAVALGARRLFLVLPDAEGDLERARRPHLTTHEARERLSAGESPGLWRLILHAIEAGVGGVVLLPGRAGCVFEELFSHAGAGVLVGDPTVEHIRPATLRDCAAVSLLLAAEIARGVVRPVTDDEVATTITGHLVYTIDGLVVGTARLSPYGRWAELSRFATLPRYRGRGRARALAEGLIRSARQAGYSDLFALSIDERMWSFFESLGFTGVPRETLPAAWLRGYDLRRPSRAFHRRLGAQASSSG